jgi:hypothetical protein
MRPLKILGGSTWIQFVYKRADISIFWDGVSATYRLFITSGVVRLRWPGNISVNRFHSPILVVVNLAHLFATLRSRKGRSRTMIRNVRLESDTPTFAIALAADQS